jgi:hypothetical protein
MKKPSHMVNRVRCEAWQVPGKKDALKEKRKKEVCRRQPILSIPRFTTCRCAGGMCCVWAESTGLGLVSGKALLSSANTYPGLRRGS